MEDVSISAESLISFLGKEYSLVQQSERDLQELIAGLREAEKTIDDAEKRQRSEPLVKTWVENMLDLAIEIEDVVDDWRQNQEILKSEERNAHAHVDSSSPWPKKVSSFFKSHLLCFKDAVRHRGTRLETIELLEKLNRLLEKNREFGFVTTEGVEIWGQSDQGRRSFHVGDDDKCFGRIDNKNVIVDMLLSEGENDDGNEIVCIVGCGGLGKTVLAQIVCGDESIAQEFALRVWIWVCDDVRMTARKIIEAAGGNISPNEDRVDILFPCVKEVLSGKKFLIVLDDAWSENSDRWEPLLKWLKGLQGSRILLTTRSDAIAVRSGGHRRKIHALDGLSTDDCWEIIRHKAFRALPERSDMVNHELQDIGKKIALKCEGLPLLAKSLGGVLATRTNVEEWEAVLENPWWDLVEKDVSGTLHLSYKDLSPVLKRCFTSCALYEKGQRMYIEELLRIWLTHVSISFGGSVNVLHNQWIGRIQELANRSFFQNMRESLYNENQCYVTMHDLIHDFAVSLSKSTYYFVMNGTVEEGQHLGYNALEKARYFCARRVSQEEVTSFVRRLKRVRVLILENCEGLLQLPENIEGLSHLRYLQLVSDLIATLPDYLCGLYHLQTLDVAACSSLTSLPQNIHELVNLRHLLVNTEHVFHEGLAKLTGLWTLNNFIAGRYWARLALLKKLNQLRGALKIYLNEMVEDAVVDAAEAKLDDKIFIKEFEIIFIRDVADDVLNALKAPPNVRRLRLGRYNFNHFPEWITSLTCLREFELFSCSCNDLPLLGKLPNLKKITLCDLVNVERFGINFLGIGDFMGASSSAPSGTLFPRLIMMSFQDCEKWRIWDDIREQVRDQNISIMPYLENITFINCPSLQILPHNLLRAASSLKCLTIKQSDRLVEYYVNGNGRHAIAQVPHVRVDIQNWKPV